MAGLLSPWQTGGTNGGFMMDPQNLAAMGISPFQAIGYSGPDFVQNNMDGGVYANGDLTNWMQQQGITPGWQQVPGNGNSTQNAFLDKNGNPIAGTQYTNNVNDDQFWTAAMLAAAGLTAGIGSGAIGGAGAAADAAATDAAMYQMGASTGALPGAGTAAGTAAGAGAAELGSSGLNPAQFDSFLQSYGQGLVPDVVAPEVGMGALGTSGTLSPGLASMLGGAGSTMAGGGMTAAQIAAAGGGASSLIPGISNQALGAGVGAIAGLTSKTNATTTTDSKLSPQVQNALWGGGGLLSSAGDWFNQNKAGNPAMQQGAQTSLNYYNDPNYAKNYGALSNVGMGLLSGGIAGNPFTSGSMGLAPRNFGFKAPGG